MGEFDWIKKLEQLSFFWWRNCKIKKMLNNLPSEMPRVHCGRISAQEKKLSFFYPRCISYIKASNFVFN